MKPSHRVCINVVDSNGDRTNVVEGGIFHLPRRLLQFLFGDSAEIFVLKPGQTVKEVIIRETPHYTGGEKIGKV